MAHLTRTQREALAFLRQHRTVWPYTRGYGADGARWTRHTLQALVDAGLARWVKYPVGAGVLSHIESTEED